MNRFVALAAPLLVVLPLAPLAAEPARLEVPLLPAEDQLREAGAPVDLRHGIDGSPRDPAPAKAWIGVHDGNLLVEWEVAGVPGEGPVRRDDLALFEGATAELFVGSAGTPDYSYYHFATDAHGSLFDEAGRDGGWSLDPGWDGPVNAEPVATADGAWGVRLAVPLALLRRSVPDGPPRPVLPQELWLQVAAVSFPKEGTPAPVTWSPTEGSFHTPDSFGAMILPPGMAAFPAAIDIQPTRTAEGVSTLVTLLDPPGGDARWTATASLRTDDPADPVKSLLEASLTATVPTATHLLPMTEMVAARTLVARLFDSNGRLVDQNTQDWFFQPEESVRTPFERFRDQLPLVVAPRLDGEAVTLRIRSLGESPVEVWSGAQPASGGTVDVDTNGWRPGPYELRWSAGAESGTLPLVKLDPATPATPLRGWTFWGYAPDEELLAEFATFSSLSTTTEPFHGFIYGGSVDPLTASLSDLNLEDLREWADAMPDAHFHLMIDGAGNFDLVDDQAVDEIARRLVEELMPVSEVSGLHLDLEPYRASQVRLTRALSRHGWTKNLSLAIGLASTVPPEQWPSLDYVAIMNYDLGKTPEVYETRARRNALAFAEAAREARRHVLVGIPAIATHHEFAVMVEAATGQMVAGSPEDSMMPFLEPSLEIVRELALDPDVGEAIGAPAIWGALARGHFVGRQRYRYFPSTIEGAVWQRLLEFDRSLAGQ